jgi:signal transduction histidine kinase
MIVSSQGISYLKSIQSFGASLNHEGSLQESVDQMIQKLAEIMHVDVGVLVYEWTWCGHHDQINSLHGPGNEDFDGFGANFLSPIFNQEGRVSFSQKEYESLPKSWSQLRQVIFIKLGISQLEGRGGIMLGKSEGDSFSEVDFELAKSLATLVSARLFNRIVLRESDRSIEVRERILAVASHDLRTPLSVLNMAVELLADSNDDSEREKLVTKANRSLGTVKRLIGDLLDFAAVDSGRLRLEPQWLNASSPCKQAVTTVENSAQQKNVKLSFYQDSDKKIFADSGRIEQALVNLLSNAIKFTPKGGKVSVALSCNDDSVVYQVVDTGPGIAEEKQRQLFERYVTSSKQGKGVGLGLSIAHGIVTAHQGSLVVESSLGEGAMFLISLPVGQEQTV